MTPKDRLQNTLKLEPIDRLPAAQPMQTATFELMNSSGSFWPEAHQSARKMAALSWEAHRMIGFESVRIPFDINVEAEAMGCALDWSRKDIQPLVKTRPIESLDELDKLQVPDPSRNGRMPVVLEAARTLSKKDETIPVIVGALGPLNVAVQLRGAEPFLMDLMLRPDDSHKLLDICQETAELYMDALDVVSDLITIIDATSSPDLIGPKEFRSFSKPRLRNVIRKRGAPCILHICGHTDLILEDMASIGALAIGLDSTVDIGKAKRIARGRCAVAGNVSAIGPLLTGEPQEVIEETIEVIEKGSDLPCTSCGIAPGTSTENLRAMVSSIHQYGSKRWQSSPD